MPKVRVRHTLDAWQYDPKAGVPVWVARRCHKTSRDDVLACHAGHGWVEAGPGDWIVRNAVGEGVDVFKQEEFEEVFMIVEEETSGCIA